MKKLLLLPLAALLLTGCINDRASYNIDGHNYALTIIRDQRYFWDQKLEMSVVAARLPDCQRRHKLPMTAPADSKIELYQTGSATFILKLSGVMYLVETTTCEGFQTLAEVPPNGLGDHLGDFYEVDGKYRFVATPAAPTPVAPAVPVGAATADPAAPAAPSAEPPSSFGPASAPVAPARP